MVQTGSVTSSASELDAFGEDVKLLIQTERETRGLAHQALVAQPPLTSQLNQFNSVLRGTAQGKELSGTVF